MLADKMFHKANVNKATGFDNTALGTEILVADELTECIVNAQWGKSFHMA